MSTFFQACLTLYRCAFVPLLPQISEPPFDGCCNRLDPLRQWSTALAGRAAGGDTTVLRL